MVGYIAQPTIVEEAEEEQHDQDSKYSNPIYPLDPLDPSSPDFAFVNSILDFDFINDFLEDTSEFDCGEKMNEMSERTSIAGTSVKLESLELEKEGKLGPSVEEEMTNFGLDVNSSVTVKSEIEDDGMLMKMVNDLGDCLVDSFPPGGDDVEDETANNETANSDDNSSDSESVKESSSSSTSSLGSSSDSDSSEEAEEKKEHVKCQLKAEVEEGDIEEGEIRDANIEEIASDTDEEEAEEGGDKMVEWSEVEFGGIDEDEEDVGVTKGPIKSKNELQVLPPVPPVDAALQPHHQMLPVGIVLSTLGAQVIVEGTEKHTPLNEGSILWITEKRSPLGLVDEIFGPVQNPYYVVRYNSESEVPSEIHQGTSISFVPEFAQHVLNDNLYKKGYDASGENDEELTDEAEFSDDEKEAEYRKMQKMTKRGMNHQTTDSKRKNRNKNRNRNGNWNNNTHSNVGQQPTNHNQHNIAAVAASTNSGSSTNGVGFFPPFPQMVPPNGIFQPPNAAWLNSLASQQPNGAFIPGGFPANNMSWPPAQNQPFLNPFNLGQGPLPNGSQMNPFGATGPSPWPAMAGQNCFNQSLLGMGFQMQPTLPIMNQGGQCMMLNQQQVQPNCNSRPQIQQNCQLQPPGDSQAAQQFKFGASSSRGRKPFRQGGGRFSGGRGRRGH